MIIVINNSISIFRLFWCVILVVELIVDGRLVMILIKIRIEILLLILCFVICLFNYIRNIVFVIKFIIVVKQKLIFGLIINLFIMFGKFVVILIDWIVVSISVLQCVYWLIFLCFCLFFFLSFINGGYICVNSCVIIEVEMYGIIFSVNIEVCLSVLLLNMLNILIMVFFCCLKKLVSIVVLILGIGMNEFRW